MKVCMVLFIIFTVLVSWAIFKQINKKKEIQKEIQKLQEEAEKITRENLSSQERIAYFESQDYQEREAKEKLNLKNPEENVVIVKPGIAKKESLETQTGPEFSQTQKESVGYRLPFS